MNEQERQALQDFLNELGQARVPNKDREAESLIMDAVRRQPDASYLLVQRALLQEQALNTAQQRIATLQQQLAATQRAEGGSFLDPGTEWGRTATARYGSGGRPARGYGGGRSYSAEMLPARPGLMGGGMGSFLGSMAGVAAGVAAGSFLFHGIDNLLNPDEAGGGGEGQGLADMSGNEGQQAQLADNAGLDTEGMPSEAGADDMGGWSGEADLGDSTGGDDYA